jgi:predicted nucleic acid-binding protein
MMVADASVWINLVATGGADWILKAIQRPVAITDVAFRELDRGRPKGRQAADEVAGLVKIGLAQIVKLDTSDEALFMSLVSGAASGTLDDGEAATLACASRLGACAIIDERKATNLAARRLSHLEVRSTTDLLLDLNVRNAFGEAVLAEAVFAALTGARMRVPERHVEAIVGLLGKKRAALCRSLPTRFRTVRSD